MTFEDNTDQISECVPPSAGQRARQEGRKPDFPGRAIPDSIHSLHMVEAAEAMGIRTTDDEGNYTGLTHATIFSVMQQWHEMRLQQENAGLAVNQLRAWMKQNMKVEGIDEMSDTQLIDHVRGLLDSVKTMVASVTPVLMTMWGNVQHVLERAGVLTVWRQGL